jgi:hypothetical protein
MAGIGYENTGAGQMMEQAYKEEVPICYHCNKQVVVGKNAVTITRYGYKTQKFKTARRTFHEECFVEIAGEDQLPEIKQPVLDDEFFQEEIKQQIQKLMEERKKLDLGKALALAQAREVKQQIQKLMEERKKLEMGKALALAQARQQAQIDEQALKKQAQVDKALKWTQNLEQDRLEALLGIK